MFNRKKTFVVSGLNQVRLLNKFTGDGLKVFAVKKLSPSEMRLAVAVKDLDKAIAIMQNLCYTYEVIHSTDFLEFIKKRFWIPLAAAALTGLIFMSNLFIWRIEISGTSGLTLVNIEKLVSDYGLHAFAYKPDDLSSLYTGILSLDEVAAATVEINGNVLKINVVESGITTPIEKGGAVVSGYDAVVTRIITESGTPLVKRGEVVKRNQPLISGELTATGDGSVTAAVEAKGSVYGTVTFMYSTIITGGYTWVPTGNVQTETSLGIFGLEWAGGEPRFECYRASTTTSSFFCFTFRQTVYEEIAAETISADALGYAQEKANALESVYGAQFEAKYIAEERDGINILKIYLSAELCLGQS